MKICVKLFAAAKEAAGNEVISLDLPNGCTVRELRAALACQLPGWGTLREHCLIAVNHQYASEQTILYPEDEVACIPPVSGG